MSGTFPHPHISKLVWEKGHDLRIKQFSSGTVTPVSRCHPTVITLLPTEEAPSALAKSMRNRVRGQPLESIFPQRLE